MTTSASRIMIIAGEASGDMHGARLVEAMHRLRPGLQFSGIGGSELAAVGVDVFFDAAKLAVVGITEVLNHLGDILAARRAVISRMRSEKPALLILIDYPDFNLLLAAKAKQLGIPVFYYISPQVWAWRSGRVKKLGRLAERIAVILPFEQEFYAQRGVAVDFVGHPLTDSVRPDALRTREEFFRAYNLMIRPETRVIGILPGSRSKEIRSLLPDFLAAATLLAEQNKQSDWLFLLPRASTVPQELLLASGLDVAQKSLHVHVLSDNRYELMAACDAAIAASGTVTLELAILGIPAVVAYRFSPRTYRLGRLLVRHLRHFSLVNLIAGREVVPELLQDEVTPAALAAQIETMLGHRHDILRGLAEVREKLGPPGCSERAAKIALSCIAAA